MASQRGEEIHQRLNEVLVLQADIADLATQADRGLEQAERLLKRYQEQVFAVDSPPLWTLLGRQDAGAGLGEQIRTALNHDRQALQSFRASAGLRPVVHLLLAAFFTALLFTLRHRSSSWDLPEADKMAAAHILCRPLSASLFLTLMATAFLYPQAPSIVFEVNRILFLLPVLRLVPGLLGRASRRPLFMLAALYLADNLVDLALERTLLQRTLLLVTTLAAMGAGLWIARRGLDGDLGRPATWLQHRLTHLAIILLAASAAANILGYVSLANLLTNGTLTSAYGVFILFAATQVLGVLISVLLHSRSAGLLHSLSRDAGLVRRKAGKLLDFMAVATWLAGTLYFFGLLGMVWNGLNRMLARQWALGSLQISLGSLLSFFAAIWISVLLSRLIRYVLMEDVMPRLPLARGMPSSIAQLVHYAIISIGFLAALGAAGIELSRFAIMAGALGVGIGFGLQSLVNNFVSGLILIFERPMQIGDKIEVGQHRGEVRRIGFRASTIRTFAGAEIIVPNGDLISKELTNWTLSDHKRRVDIPVGVAYGSDPEQIIQILKDVADGEPDALKRPEPKVHFMEFGNSSLNFVLRFWTPKFDEWWGVHSRINLGIHQALKEAGVTIPFPQRDLHLRSVDGQAASLLVPRTGGKDAGGERSGD
jgi:small-conductance mechanosensitive channel